MQSPEQIKAAVRDLSPWHFAIDIVPGIRTTDYNLETYANNDLNNVGSIDPEEMRPLLTCILPGGLAGKSFLDVGCNGGGYCFIAHELGAKNCYGFDVRDHWINQANYIRSVKYPATESIVFSKADVQQVTLDQKFDVTLFKGVLYHLPDPIHMLIKLCSVTSRVIIIDTASRNDIPVECFVATPEHKTQVMSGVDGFCWYPGGPEALTPLLSWCGFPHVRVVYHQVGAKTGRKRGRFRIIAARGARDFAEYDKRFPRGLPLSMSV